MLSLLKVRSTVLSAALVAGAAFWASPARADLMVTGGKNVFQYNVNTGALDNKFGSAQITSGAEGIAVRPSDHDIFVLASTVHTGTGNDQVFLYSPTGTFISAFTSNGQGLLFAGQSMIYGPDGNLYVAGGQGNDVLRYTGSGTSGANNPGFGETQAVFSSATNSPAMSPSANIVGLTFNGANLLATDAQSTATTRVYSIDANGIATSFISDPTHLNSNISDIKVGPDGKIYIADGGSVFRYNSNGTFDTTYASGLGHIVGLAFYPNFFGTSLFISDSTNNVVWRWDQNGYAVQFAPQSGNPEGLTSPQFLILDPPSNPEPGTLTLVGICSLLGAAGYRWQKRRQPATEGADAPAAPAIEP